MYGRRAEADQVPFLCFLEQTLHTQHRNRTNIHDTTTGIAAKFQGCMIGQMGFCEYSQSRCALARCKHSITHARRTIIPQCWPNKTACQHLCVLVHYWEKLEFLEGMASEL